MLTKGRLLLLCFMAFVAWLIHLAFFAFPDVTVRYRIEADFEFDGSPVRASGVWEITYDSHYTLRGSWKGITTSMNTDAAMAKLANGGFLFLRVDGPDLNYRRYEFERWNHPNLIPLKLLGLERAGDRETIDALRQAASERRWMSFGLDLLPKIWVLPDPDDPTTLYEPDVCDMAAQCRLRFMRGTIKFVKDRDTFDIVSTFPWLAVPHALWTKEQIEKLSSREEYPATYMFKRRTP